MSETEPSQPKPIQGHKTGKLSLAVAKKAFTQQERETIRLDPKLRTGSSDASLANQKPIKYAAADSLNVDTQFKKDAEDDLENIVNKIGAINGEFEFFVKRPNGDIVVLYSARFG